MRPQIEKIVLDSHRSLKCFEFEKDAFDCPFHFHPEFEITRIVSSSGVRVVGDHSGTFAPGDLVLHGENLPHLYRSVCPAGAGSERARAQVIQFRRDFLGAGFFALPETAGIKALLERGARGLFFTGPFARNLGELISAMMVAQPLARITGLVDILGRMSTARLVEPLSSPGYMPLFRPGESSRLDRACAEVNDHYYDPELTQERVARQVGMSPAAFSRFFRQRTRQTFSHYLRDVRLGQACRMLQETEDTILTIAFACGFGNLSHFNRCFREIKRMTPSAYRQSLVAGSSACAPKTPEDIRGMVESRQPHCHGSA
jgi:AraC-like DNA-binding protein